MKEALAKLGTIWTGIPQPLRDFGEGLVAAAVGGAALGVLGVNLLAPDLTAKVIEAAAITGATAAALAYLRHKLADSAATITTAPTAPPPAP